MFFDLEPTYTAAYSVLPYSPGLESAYTFISKFGDTVSMARRAGASLWVPRETVPVSTFDARAYKTPAAIDCNFTPVNEEQAPLAEKCLALLNQGVSHIFEAPTGWGKSVEGSYIAASFGQPTLIVVHKADLLDSWYDALVNILGVDPKLIGKVQQDECVWQGKQFVLAMVQSLIIPDRYPEEMYRYFGLMILDEVHTMAADCFVNACWMVSAKLRLGFSATPNRADGKWAVVEAHIGVVQCRGTLIPMSPKILVKKTGWKIPRAKLYDRDLGYAVETTIPHSPGRMALVYNAMAESNQRNDEISKFTQAAYNSGRTILLVAATKDHLTRIFQILTSDGIPGDDIGYYVGGMSKIALGHTKKKRVVLGTAKMVSTGTNVPHWDSLVLMTPVADVRQIAGRILRLLSGKKQPVILDLVDDSNLLNNFFLSRLKYYYSINSEIKYMQ